jgi:hypothetical protein
VAETFISEIIKNKIYTAPSKESLLEKIISLELELSQYEDKKLNEKNKEILHICKAYIQTTKECMRGFWSHPHLIWNLLHRVDEHIILLMPEDELYARAVDVKTSFNLTITEEKIRTDVLGDKGRLTEAIENIKKHGENIDRSRHIVKDILQYINKNVDTGYWILSMNTLMSVCSAALVGALMILSFYKYDRQLFASINEGSLLPFAILGLMGAYISNLLTKQDFLFVRGGPFWRFLFHNLMTRPIVGAFSATFVFLVEKTKLVFSINSAAEALTTQVQSTIININVDKSATQYVYIVIGIATGFAGEKILRNMLDTVLKRLETKAEKTKDTKIDTSK